MSKMVVYIKDNGFVEPIKNPTFNEFNTFMEKSRVSGFIMDDENRTGFLYIPPHSIEKIIYKK